MRLLVVDDQRSARRVVAHMLNALADVEVVEARSVEEAQRIFESTPIDALLLDIRLSDNPTDRGGLELLNWVRSRGRDTPAVMITAVSELGEIREAMRQGAQDYVLKDDLCAEMLLPIIDGLRERLALRGEVARLRRQVDSAFGLKAIVGSSMAIERVRRLVERVANADAPVLIRGETGSGKELVARAIHHSGSRSAEPFLAVNCSALPGTLIESLIFGHQRGAFTGAERRVRGQLELAGRGTILLDEIAEMPIELQAKLLRVLEERRFRPLGAEEELPFQARVLAATHVDIERRILDGSFREDLYYRLNVVTLEVPSLAEREDDVLELLQSFTALLPRRLHFTDDAIDWVRRRRWAGNVRELKNAVERLSLLAESDLIDAATLTEIVGEDSGRIAREVERMAKALLALPERVGSKLDALERAVLHLAIESCGGNKSAAARLLGVHRKSLDRRLERFSVPAAPDSE
jgi:DNA-binding NtrC family response regulator